MEKAARLKSAPAAGFALRFLVISITLFVLMEIAPDALFYPLNRINAILAAGVLKLFGLSVTVMGITLVFNDFRAQVVGECSAVFAAVLPLAFMLAYPAGLRRKAMGLLVALPLIFLVNVGRISLLVLVGGRAPHLFDPVHLYLGQTAIMLLIVTVCYVWTQWVHGRVKHHQAWKSILKCIALSCAGYALWHLLGEPYTWLQYRAGRALLGALGTEIGLPAALKLYPDTFLCFNLVTFTVLMGTFIPWRRYPDGRRYWLAGIGLMAGLHFVFRFLQMYYLATSARGPLAWGITALLVVNEWLLPFGLFLYVYYRYRRWDSATA